MADKIRTVDYYYTRVPDRPGTGAKLLSVFRGARLLLQAVHAFPVGRRTQIDLVPANNRAFLRAAREAKIKLSRRKRAILVEGKDRIGALQDILAQVADVGVNVTAVTALRAGRGRFGAILWVKPADLQKTAKALGAR